MGSQSDLSPKQNTCLYWKSIRLMCVFVQSPRVARANVCVWWGGQSAARLAAAAAGEDRKDRRNLYLAREGLILPDSPAAT